MVEKRQYIAFVSKAFEPFDIEVPIDIDVTPEDSTKDILGKIKYAVHDSIVEAFKITAICRL